MSDFVQSNIVNGSTFKHLLKYVGTWSTPIAPWRNNVIINIYSSNTIAARAHHKKRSHSPQSMLASSLIPIFIISVLLAHHAVAQSSCATGEKPFKLEIKFDDEPFRTTWLLMDECDQKALIEGSGQGVLGTPGQLYTENKCLKDGRNYSFEIADSAGGGRCLVILSLLDVVNFVPTQLISSFAFSCNKRTLLLQLT